MSWMGKEGGGGRNKGFLNGDKRGRSSLISFLVKFVVGGGGRVVLYKIFNCYQQTIKTQMSLNFIKITKWLNELFVIRAHTAHRPGFFWEKNKINVHVNLKLNYCSQTPLNFLPCEFLLVKRLEIKKTKTTFLYQF